MDFGDFLSELDCIKVVKDTLGLAETKNVKVINYEIKKLEGFIAGYLAEHFRLLIIAQVNDKLQEFKYFLKTLPVSNPEQRNIVEDSGVFKKEANIYIHILKHLPDEVGTIKWKPHCYLARDDILLLEDLTLTNWRHLPNRFKYSKNHVQTILRSLATMHACSLNFEQNVLKMDLDTSLGQYLNEVSLFEDCIWFVTGLKAIEAVALKKTKYSGDQAISSLIKSELMSKMKAVVNHLENTPTRFKNVFCHRDTWSNNLMFQFKSNQQGQPDFEEPLSCCLLDFQISRYQPPAIDVLMCAFLTQLKACRDKDLIENQTFYYSILKKTLLKFQMNLEEFITFDCFLESCEYFKFVALILKGLSATMLYLPPEVIDELHKSSEDYNRFINIDRTPEVLHYIDVDTEYRNWMVEATEEIIEACLLKPDAN